MQNPLQQACAFLCRHTKKRDNAAHIDARTMTNLQNTQSPPLPFSCVECGKAFAQKNHLASHVYHKHPHAYVRKSSSSCREGGASGSVGGDSCREGTAAWGGTTSPSLKNPKEQLGFMQSVTSGNQLANLDVGGRSLMESPFMRGSPSTLNNDQQHTLEVLTLQEGSREIPSTRENSTMSEGLSSKERSGDHAVVKGSSSSKRSELGS